MPYRSRGFGLVETLIASLIISMLILTFYGISSAVTNNVRLANERATAAHFAEEGLELVSYWRTQSSVDSRNINGPNVSSANSWDAAILAHKNVNNVVESSVKKLNGIDYTREVTVTNAASTSLPRVSAKQDVTGTWQNLSHSDYANQYWYVTAKVTWPGRVTGNTYTITSLLTNWQSITP